jgi:predicted patatin/cPLA2 family phospholipase
MAVVVLACGSLVTGCASIDRAPAVPLALASVAKPLDIPDARFYPDTDTEAMKALAHHVIERRKRYESRVSQKPINNDYLAISGGGDDGAFGAGLLAGWTERGDRPDFGVVTGISTGALSAPFVFLGPEYDPQLKKVYTETEASDVFIRRPVLAAFTDDALADSAPLRNMIASYVDRRMISKIAAEYEKGRLLLVATTNLDQSRAVIWNIGAIAQSGDPRARDLIIDVLVASASIPGAFPPVMLNMTINGKHFEEMHVDGGAIAQSFLYPPSIRVIGRKDRKHRAFIIRNGRLFRPEANVDRRTLSIAGQSIATMTATSGLNDTFRIFLTTSRDGVDFNLAYIDEGFTLPYRGPFDRGYMRELYAYGYKLGRAGYKWRKTPPGFQE